MPAFVFRITAGRGGHFLAPARAMTRRKRIERDGPGSAPACDVDGKPQKKKTGHRLSVPLPRQRSLMGGGGVKRTRSSPQLPRTIEIYASRFIDFFFPPNRRTRRFWAMFRRPLPPGRVDLRFYRNNPLRDNTRLSWRDLKFLFAWEGPGEQCGAQTTKNSSTIEIKNNLNEYYQR